MTDGYPRGRIADVLVRGPLPPCVRIFPRHHRAAPLEVAPGDSRFCTVTDDYTVLYAAAEFATAFAEVVVRDRFTRRKDRSVDLVEVTGRAWAQIHSADAPLRLLDLRGDGCMRLGAPTDAVRARSHAAGRALGRSVYHEHGDTDGLLFWSRLTGGDVYAIFDRALGRLRVANSGDLARHPELPSVLARYGIRLIRYN